MIDPVTMEIHRPIKKEFMGKFDRFEPVNMDHTAVIAAKQCLRKYFFQIVLGRVPKEEAVYFAWGTSYHKFRHALEDKYGFGDNTPTKFDIAKASSAFQIANQHGLNYWKVKGKDQDVTSKFSWMTQKRLEKSFIAAFKHWMTEKQRGNIHVLAVEQPFNILMPDGSNRGGTADQIIVWMQEKTLGRDFKTTSKDSNFYERTLTPNDQFTGYTYCEGGLAGTQVQGQMVELLFNAKSTKKEDKGPEIITLMASRTKYQLEDWLKGHGFWIDVIEQAREKDNYPMSEVGCAFCPYHGVCSKNSEGAMIFELEQNYMLRPWDHSKVGQE